jgi:hypothetical protein
MDSKSTREASDSETWIDRVYEPTKTDLRGPRKTDDLWLHNGEDLTIFQRVGFLFFFWLPALAIGLGLSFETIKLLRERDSAMLLSGAIAAGCLYIAFRGIKNVLLFKRPDQPAP